MKQQRTPQMSIDRASIAAALNYCRSFGECDLIGKIIKYAEGPASNWIERTEQITAENLRDADLILESRNWDLAASRQVPVLMESELNPARGQEIRT